MEKLTFRQEINASVQRVYEATLGLNDKSFYEYWTAPFNPTSTYEGTWDEGSKIYFVGVDENGNKGGMVSEVIENIPAKRVAVRHYGFLDGDVEVTSGEQVEKWAGGVEAYNFEVSDGRTIVVVELDTIDDYLEYFKEKYPKALQKLKELCEKG